jgi:hypothetical protein
MALGLAPDQPVLLITGGSQGSRTLRYAHTGVQLPGLELFTTMSIGVTRIMPRGASAARSAMADPLRTDLRTPKAKVPVAEAPFFLGRAPELRKMRALLGALHFSSRARIR